MNKIHETAQIGPNVILGSNNYIGPYCYITGNTIIGDDNRFEAFCSIGTSAEHRDFFKDQEGEVTIGSNNIFREYTTINAGTKLKTIIQNDVVMLRGSHVGHDSFIADKVNLSCNTLIGGHSILMEGCNFGLGAICHQFSVIGAYSMIGMGSIVTKTTLIKPGNIYVGSPSRFLKTNSVGLERNNITQEKLLEFIENYNKLLNKI